MIRREVVAGVPGEFITMPDGMQFHVYHNRTDDQLRLDAQDIAAFTACHKDYEQDDDGADDGYGWERKALEGIAL